MKQLLQLEEAAMTALAIYIFDMYNPGLSIWAGFLLFFLPDVSMFGYLVNARAGAISYNIFHHRGIAIACVATGYFLNNEVVLSMGILLFAHASFDRAVGYGLKYYRGFKDTHLGSLKTSSNGNENRTIKRILAR